MAVIIEAPHQAGIEHKGNLESFEGLAHLAEALVAVSRQGSGQGGGTGQQGLGVGIFGIKHPQGVGADALLGIGIELVVVGLQPGHQFGPVAQPIFWGAEGVDLQLQAADAEVGQ